MRRRALRVLLLAFVSMVVFAGNATAAQNPPIPENPMANGGSSALVTKPDPLPPPNVPFDANDLLSQYGTAGATFHYYELNPLEQVGAGLWVELSNNAMDLPKMVISAVASFANWVFNPRSFLDMLSGPTDDTSRVLRDNLAGPWLPIILIMVGIGITWGAKKGHIGMALTRVVYVLIGLGLVGLSVATPSSIAGTVSGFVSETVSGILVPTPQQVDDEVKSDADAKAYADAKAQAQATVGSKMLGPIWKAAVYDPWVLGTFGSTSSQTAKDNAQPLFESQAFTWREAADMDGNKDKTAAAVKADQDKWKATAGHVNDIDPNAYQYVQGKNANLGPVFVAWVVTLACIPFIAVALLMTLGGYIALYLLAALLPVIGMAVILHPPLLGKVGKFLAAVLVNTVVFAAASVAITKIAGALLSGGNILFATMTIAVMSFVAWKFLKAFRGFKHSPAEAAKAGVTNVMTTTEVWKERTKGTVSKAATVGVAAATGGAAAAVAMEAADRPDGSERSPVEGAPEPAVYTPKHQSDGKPAPVGVAAVNGHAENGTIAAANGHATNGHAANGQATIASTAPATVDPETGELVAGAPEAPRQPHIDSRPVAPTMPASVSAHRTPYTPPEPGVERDATPDVDAPIPGAQRDAEVPTRVAYDPATKGTYILDDEGYAEGVVA